MIKFSTSLLMSYCVAWGMQQAPAKLTVVQQGWKAKVNGVESCLQAALKLPCQAIPTSPGAKMEQKSRAHSKPSQGSHSCLRVHLGRNVGR